MAWLVMWAALLLTLSTGLDYVKEAIKLRRRATREDQG